jgi:hypothetical protein
METAAKLLMRSARYRKPLLQNRAKTEMAGFVRARAEANGGRFLHIDVQKRQAGSSAALMVVACFALEQCGAALTITDGTWIQV